MTRGSALQYQAADYVIEILVVAGSVMVVPLKSRTCDLPSDPNDPRVASLQAAVHRFIEGDAA